MVFRSKFLRRLVVLPLTTAAVVALLLAVLVPWQGLFVNICSSFIAILVTVGYVDLILGEHEKRRWADATKNIGKRLQKLATVAGSQFRTAFRISPEVLGHESHWGDPSSVRRKMIEVNNNTLIPAVPIEIPRLTQNGWRQLITQMQITYEGFEKLINVYGNWINPEIFSGIMEIQDSMWSTIELYATFPDVLGVPDEDLRDGRDPIGLKRFLEREASKNAVRTLQVSSQLLLYLEKRS